MPIIIMDGTRPLFIMEGTDPLKSNKNNNQEGTSPLRGGPYPTF